MFFHLHLQCKPQLHEEVFAFTEVSLELHENRTPSNFCKKKKLVCHLHELGVIFAFKNH